MNSTEAFVANTQRYIARPTVRTALVMLPDHDGYVEAFLQLLPFAVSADGRATLLPPPYKEEENWPTLRVN